VRLRVTTEQPETIEQRRVKINIMRFSDAKVENLEPDLFALLKKNTEIINDKPVLKKGIFLYGTVGSGKTYALYAIKACYNYSFYNFVDFLISLKDGFNRKNYDFSLGETIDVMFKNKGLCIDDLGVEKESEWTHEILYSIINRAYNYLIPICISTNLSLDDFTKKYGERITSRLLETSVAYQMQSADKRLTN
jgi:DNA replication protein DnaC